MKSGTFVLPACPKLCARFGAKLGTLTTAKPIVIENNPLERLVKLHLPDAGDFWVVDKSQYFTEFIELTPKLDDGTIAADVMENWVRLPRLRLAQGKIDEREFNHEIGLE